MRFSFGENWLSYSKRALDDNKIEAARKAFGSLMRGVELHGRRFLDIGFGQGLALFLAAEAGADVYGIDVDPICRDALEATHRFFPSQRLPKTEVSSILDDAFIRAQQPAGGFDVVHSWGALHHTGDMSKAFRNAAAIVKRGGFLIISIYNRHWTSPLWRPAKYFFNHLPHFLRRIIALFLSPLFYLRARSLSANGSHLTLRGMDFAHDILDWLGGWPYEYASPAEVQEVFFDLGFRLIRCRHARGFTGCNEFVFQRRIDSGEEAHLSETRQTA